MGGYNYLSIKLTKSGYEENLYGLDLSKVIGCVSVELICDEGCYFEENEKNNVINEICEMLSLKYYNNKRVVKPHIETEKSECFNKIRRLVFTVIVE